MRPWRVLETIVVLMVFPTSTVWAQEAIHGCVKNNGGQIRIVAAGDACLPSEHPIQWPVGEAGTPAPTVTPATPLLRVVDANGVEVGLLASPNKAARVEGNVWIGLPAKAAGFDFTAATSVQRFYQSADCSGDAYLAVDMNNMLRTGSVVDENGVRTFWYAGLPEVDRSTIHSVAVGQNCSVNITVPTYMPLFGMAATVDVTAFVAPFRVVQK